MKKFLFLLSLILTVTIFVSCDNIINEASGQEESSEMSTKTTQVTTEETTEEETTEEVTTEGFIKYNIKSNNPDLQLALENRNGDVLEAPKRGESESSENLMEKNYYLSQNINLSKKFYGTDKISLLPSAINIEENRIPPDSYLKVPVYGADGRLQDILPITTFGTYKYSGKNKGFYKNDVYGFRAVGIATDDNISEIYGFCLDLALEASSSVTTTAVCLDDSYMYFTFDEDVDFNHIESYLSAIRIAFIDRSSDTISIYARLDTSDIQKIDDGYTAKIYLADESGEPLTNNGIIDMPVSSTFYMSMLFYLDGYGITNSDVVSSASSNIQIGFDICFK